jgi:hypothetical protein
VFRLGVAKKIEKLLLVCVCLHESIEPGPGAAMRKSTMATSRTDGCSRRRAAIAGA